MKRIILKLLSGMFLMLLCGSVAHAFKLPDTGQTTCYDAARNLITCPSAGQPLAQDGSYNINPLSYRDNNNGTVTDNNTGLMWQKQDDGNVYSSFQAFGTYHPTYNPTSQNVCGELRIGGYSDWRLPSKQELMSIVHYGKAWPSPAVDAKYFPDTKSFYWTSTRYAYAYESPCVWNLTFASGTLFDDSCGPSSVRCVRGREFPAQSLEDNGNGTVTDKATGLMWQQDEVGQMQWADSLEYCENLSLAGRADWRLPNIKELESITDDTSYYPAINTIFFPNAYSSPYWTSTPATPGNMDNLPASYLVKFAYGGTSGNWNSNSNYVRCVLGGGKSSPLKDDSHVALVKVAVDLAPGSGPDIISGHAWIEVRDLLSGTRKTWGTWEDADSIYGSLYPNRELNRSPAASRSLFVTKKQYDQLMGLVHKYESKGDHAWSLLNNCTAFAKDAWQSVSGEKIDAYFIEDIGFPRPVWPNPISAMYSIIDLNGGFSDRTINQCDSPYCASPCPPPAIFCN